jgi:hypothetical protein
MLAGLLNELIISGWNTIILAFYLSGGTAADMAQAWQSKQISFVSLGSYFFRKEN